MIDSLVGLPCPAFIPLSESLMTQSTNAVIAQRKQADSGFGIAQTGCAAILEFWASLVKSPQVLSLVILADRVGQWFVNQQSLSPCDTVKIGVSIFFLNSLDLHARMDPETMPLTRMRTIALETYPVVARPLSCFPLQPFDDFAVFFSKYGIDIDSFIIGNKLVFLTELAWEAVKRDSVQTTEPVACLSFCFDDLLPFQFAFVFLKVLFPVC